MRLPLRHPPPRRDALRNRCAYLESLAHAAVGLPLGPAARAMAPSKARGRHGNALQWHFGLDPFDHHATPDWEQRIEIKLVSVWSRATGRLACDKLKVCDAEVDPWVKLANVLWVIADRLTRVVIGYVFSNLAGAAREALEHSWTVDPHFEAPAMFIESRDGPGGSDPAYYIAARWLNQFVLGKQAYRGVFPFDESLRGAGQLVLWRGASATRCPHCGAPIHITTSRLEHGGAAAARHGMPLGACAVASMVVVDSSRLCLPVGHALRPYLEAALEGTTGVRPLRRLVHDVPEPEDHLH